MAKHKATLNIKGRKMVDALLEQTREAKHMLSFTSHNLLSHFGSKSPLSKMGVQCLYKAIRQNKDERIKILFNQWKKIFGEIYGTGPSKNDKTVNKLGLQFGISRPASFELLFTLHTYYAILMKFLATKVVETFGNIPHQPIKKCAMASTSEELKVEVENLEKDATWSKFGFKNFLGSDIFSWYLFAWNSDIANFIRKLTIKLNEYDLTVSSADLAKPHDMLKKLYENLLPRKITKSLGEFYTPDWLAERLLNQLNYNGNPDKRLLEPGCGSGTFILIAINRIKKWYEKHRAKYQLSESELVKKITQNIIGFDINPLAVLASRTNYLIATRDFLKFAEPFEIPIYMYDLILPPIKRENVIELANCFGKFLTPSEIATSPKQVNGYFEILGYCIENSFSFQDFVAKCKSKHLPLSDIKLHENFYQQLLNKNRKNKFVVFILKNYLLSSLIEPVDYVVGNPPWVPWRSLPTNYRNAVAQRWKNTGLFTQRGWRAKVAAGETDLAALFVYASFDRFVKDDGKLGFVLTQTIFKAYGGGEGFRQFRCQSGKYFAPLVVEDLSALAVFPGASNRPAIAIFQSGIKPVYPVDYMEWQPKNKRSVEPSDLLEKVLNQFNLVHLAAMPINKEEPSSPWITLPKEKMEIVRKLVGRSAYRAREGVNTGGANAVYWVDKIEEYENYAKIQNSSISARKKVKQVIKTVESNLIYPLLRGRDVLRWCAKPSKHILLPYTPKNPKKAIPETVFKKEYLRSFSFFLHFRRFLSRRPEYLRWGSSGPFYEVYRIGDYSFSPFKVVWQHTGLSKKMRAAVVGTWEGKTIIPDQKVIMVPFEKEEEAHYFCALLNSSLAFLLLSGYLVLDASPHILNYMRIPFWDDSNPIHRKLSELSRKIHILAAVGKNVSSIEAEIDNLAAQIWDISG